MPYRALVAKLATVADLLREWVLNVGRRDALERIAHLLCELHARMQVAPFR